MTTPVSLTDRAPLSVEERVALLCDPSVTPLPKREVTKGRSSAIRGRMYVSKTKTSFPLCRKIISTMDALVVQPKAAE